MDSVASPITQDFLRQWYEQEAERNDQVNIYRVPHARRRMETIRELLMPIVHNARVLDIGCGMGLYTKWCMDVGAKEAVGVDIAQRNIDQAQDTWHDPGLSFMQASWDELPANLVDFDVVLATEVLEHAIYPDHLARECLSRGKYVVASSPISEPEWEKPFDVQGHLHSFRRSTFEALFDVPRYTFTDELYCYVVACVEV